MSTITQVKPSDFVGFNQVGQVTGVKTINVRYDQVLNDEGKVTEDVTFQVPMRTVETLLQLYL